MRTSDNTARLRAFMETGGQVVGQMAGAAVGTLSDPVLGAGVGAGLGDVLAKAGLEIHERVLAPRQAARAAGALDVAYVEVTERMTAGEHPRADGFFEHNPPGRAAAEEVLEGTLLTAADAYEERKVPFLGRFYASLSFDPSVSAAHANFLLRLAERLTYNQLVILAFFAEAQSGEFQTALVDISEGSGGWLPNEALLAEMNDLSDARLLGLRQNDGSVIAPQGTWGDSGWKPSNLLHADLMPIARALYRLMELSAVSRPDIQDVLVGLQGS